MLVNRFREYGKTTWTSAPEVFNEDFDIIRGLEPGITYLFRVVSVDGDKTMPSDEEEVYTYTSSKLSLFLSWTKYALNILSFTEF